MTRPQKHMLAVLAFLWAAIGAGALAARGQAVYVSPGTSTMPAVEGTGVQLLTTVYMGSANRLYADRVKPTLSCVRGTWPDLQAYYDPDAVDELAAYLLAGGKDRVVFDWEQLADNETNRQTFLRIVWRLQDRGISVSYYGGDPRADRFYVAQNSANEVHAVFYQYTLDADLWLRQRTEAIEKIRSTWPGRRIVVWLCPFHSADGDGPDNPPIPVGQFVGRAMWGRQLAWCKQHKLDVVVWMASFDATGNYLPFDTKAEWWGMLKDFALPKAKPATTN